MDEDIRSSSGQQTEAARVPTKGGDRSLENDTIIVIHVKLPNNNITDLLDTKGGYVLSCHEYENNLLSWLVGLSCQEFSGGH